MCRLLGVGFFVGEGRHLVAEGGDGRGRVPVCCRLVGVGVARVGGGGAVGAGGAAGARGRVVLLGVVVLGGWGVLRGLLAGKGREGEEDARWSTAGRL